MATVVVLFLVMVVVLLGVVAVNRAQKSRSNAQLADAKADARRVIERLGGQVYNLTGTDAASKQALADAGERFNAAGSQIEQATSPAQARLAKETALEGLYYVSAARTAMGMDPGPAVPELDGQRSAGRVTENRAIEFDGRRVEASPTPSAATPNYYPGGRVAGRPVPAGWYSEPWWKTALVAGAWGVGSVVLFDALFSGMSGVGYDTAAFENGYGDGYQAGLDAAGGGGYDQGGYDQGDNDPGYGQNVDPGADLGGQDFGDYGDFGGFDAFDSDF
ncbi:DUF1542 domain-containing protein [Nocardia yunnanensis]|uniref:DUF1542 domain-containing protein n=1 Tax=Nocardia yunnanensis TaxID=2382165 RepID=A0A386ZI83_9NOCA|nr:DUF1542 domain-containing protein [Nocardia yunnanensis]AYF76844.1 DUF1542 domain-containing protein [Nocardia yunnanensis]